ncbi:hypothetical protein ACTFIZ_009579 [Dictyostelium cf. discoideum]
MDMVHCCYWVMSFKLYDTQGNACYFSVSESFVGGSGSGGGGGGVNNPFINYLSDSTINKLYKIVEMFLSVLNELLVLVENVVQFGIEMFDDKFEHFKKKEFPKLIKFDYIVTFAIRAIHSIRLLNYLIDNCKDLIEKGNRQVTVYIQSPTRTSENPESLFLGSTAATIIIVFPNCSDSYNQFLFYIL